jgi:hypothetical protein
MGLRDEGPAFAFAFAFEFAFELCFKLVILSAAKDPSALYLRTHARKFLLKSLWGC